MTLSQERQEGLWLLWIGISMLLACLWFAIAWKRRNKENNTVLLSVLVLLLGTVCGALGAKLIFILFRINMFSFARLPEWFTLHVENVTYYGGVIGVCFGVFLAAKIARQAPGKVLNACAPMGAFLAAMARFAEAFLGYAGVGMYLDGEPPFPLAVRFTWDGEWFEYYLAVFVFEGIFSLVACVISLCHGKEKHRFLRTLFYLCLPQVLCESLRMNSISWRFVRSEMLFCFLWCECVMVWYAIKADRKKFSSWIPALTGFLVAGVIVFLEFVKDGKITFGGQMVSHWIVYGVMALCLVGIAFAEHRGYKRIQNA